MSYGLDIAGFSYPSVAQSERYKRENYSEWADNVEANHRQRADAAAAGRRYKAMIQEEKDMKNAKRRQEYAAKK